MNSPLVLFENTLPQDLLNIIQSYLINDFAYKVLNEYFDYLYYKKELYEDFVYYQYVKPNCKCIRYFNSIAQRWKTRDCYNCDIFEYTYKYMPLDFRMCIHDNYQYQKIRYGEKVEDKIYDEEQEIVDYYYDHINPFE